MKSVIVLISCLCVATNAFDYENYRDYVRPARASTGSYSGFVNGQHYGGTYYAPDDGPVVHHRYGDREPSGGSGSNSRKKPNIQDRFGDDLSGSRGRPPSGSGSFAGSSAGGFGGSGPNYKPSAYYPFQGPDAQPFRTPYEFYDFVQNFFSTFNNRLSVAFQKNAQIQRDAFSAAMQAFKDTSQQSFGGSPNINYGPYSAGASSGAFSSGSYGPQGGHISAGVYPENPSRPNVHTRFSNDDRPGKPGGVGISTSSFVSASDVNGKKAVHKQSTTSINENGKVTTYTVENK